MTNSIYSLAPLMQVFYVLKKSKENGVRELLAREISKTLLEKYEIDLTTISVSNLLRFAPKGSVKVHRKKGARYYELLKLGKDLLNSELGKPQPVDVGKCSIPKTLRAKLSEEFEEEIRELTVAETNECGLCQAFLLRRILEKTLFIVLARYDETKNLIYDKNHRVKPLSTLIDIAKSNKVGGSLILSSHTAKELNGVKFLGDTAAHNPFYTVDSETVNKQMPYITTALGELSKRL